MMKKSVCLSQDSNLGSLIYLYGLIQPIRGRNRVKYLASLRTLDFSIPTPKVLASCITKVVKEIEQIKSGKFDVQKKNQVSQYG